MHDTLLNIYRKLNKLPNKVNIEACSLCQLKCRDCYMREYVKQEQQPIIGSGYLKFKDFKKFTDKHPFIKRIELSLSGEIFLNPELSDIIKYAYEKGVKLTAFNGVNFNTISEELLEILVKYNFTGLTISIDGASQQSYSLYRTNGDFNRVIENIKKLNLLKSKYNSIFPVLVWQYIIFKHNINEIADAVKLAKDLNFAQIYFKEPWNKEVNMRDLKIPVLIRINTNGEIQKILNEEHINICSQLWLSPQINWDGRLLGCHCSTHRDLDVNVFKFGLKRALNSKKMKFMRNVLTGGGNSDDTIACHRCFMYFNMRDTNSYINANMFRF